MILFLYSLNKGGPGRAYLVAFLFSFLSLSVQKQASALLGLKQISSTSIFQVRGLWRPPWKYGHVTEDADHLPGYCCCAFRAVSCRSPRYTDPFTAFLSFVQKASDCVLFFCFAFRTSSELLVIWKPYCTCSCSLPPKICSWESE